MEASEPEKAQSLQRLMAERNELHRRLTALELEFQALESAQRDDLVTRVAAIERNVAFLAHQLGSAHPPGAAVPAAPQAGARPMQQPAPPAPPAPSQPPAPRPQPPAVPSAPLPRIVGERFARGALVLLSTSDREASAVCWLPEGTRLLVTGIESNGRTQVVHRDTLLWADSDRLAPAPLGTAEAPQLAALPAQVPAATPAAPRSRTPAEPPVWTRPGFVPKLLALVGAAVTLIGVAFLLILAAQFGLYPPEARTISAAVLAAVLIGLAFVVRKRDPRNVGAPILAATGVAAAYLSVVAATVVYGWLHPLAGVALAAIIGLAGLLLARHWANQWVALVCVLGSLILAPFIGRGEEVLTAMLMLIVTAVTLWFERGTDWRIFPFARVLPTSLVLLSLALGMLYLPPEDWPLLIGLTVALALLGLASAIIASPEPRDGQVIALGLIMPMVLPVTFTSLHLDDPLAAGAVLGMVAVAYAAVGFLPMVHQRVRWAAVPLGAGFALMAVLAATQLRYLGLITLVFSLVYLSVAARSKSTVHLIVGGVLAAVGIAVWLPLLSGFLVEAVAIEQGPEQIAQSLVGIAVIVMASKAAKAWTGEVLPRAMYLGWSLAIAMGSLAIIFTASWIGVLAGNPKAGYQIGQAIVTIAWMVLCIVFLRLGLAEKEHADVWLHLALAIAALAVAKLFLLDLGMLDALARIGAFLVVGLLLLFVGTRYARAWERVHGTRAAGTAPPSSPAVPPQPSTPFPGAPGTLALPPPPPTAPAPPVGPPAPLPPPSEWDPQAQAFSRPEGSPTATPAAPLGPPRA